MLKIVATPIGNLKDISPRAIESILEADVVLCEDTRETIKLLKLLNVPPKRLLSYYDKIETVRTEEVIELVASENKVVLLSDAGTPLISDPGYKLVRAAVLRGVKIESIPGPTALISALVISGLPPDKFLFLGYPPEKDSHQKDLIKKLKSMPLKTTVIFYVSPHKIIRFLGNLDLKLEIVICRELTKMYEEVWRGTVSDALAHFKNPRGEFVLLFSLKDDKITANSD